VNCCPHGRRKYTCVLLPLYSTFSLTSFPLPPFSKKMYSIYRYTGFIRGILRGVRYAKSLRVLFWHRRPPSWATRVLYSRAVFIFNEPALRQFCVLQTTLNSPYSPYMLKHFRHILGIRRMYEEQTGRNFYFYCKNGWKIKFCGYNEHMKIKLQYLFFGKKFSTLIWKIC